MENDNKKPEYITSQDLDKRFEEQTQVIVEAVDSILSKRLGETETKLEKKIDNVRSELYTVRKELVDKIDGTESRLGEKINNLQTDVDGFIKKQADSEDENVIIKEEVKQMKSAFKEKLGVEISAV